MFQQRRNGRHMTPRGLNCASMSIDLSKSPLVAFQVAYIHSGLSTYSRIRDTSAFHSLRFVRWLGIAYQRSSRMRSGGERRGHVMALKIQQQDFKLVRVINMNKNGGKGGVTSVSWLAVPSTMMPTPSLIFKIEPVLPLLFPNATRTWSPTKNCRSKSSMLTSTRVGFGESLSGSTTTD